MARETKAERLVREAAERLERDAFMAATYPERLMTMLERATKVNFELEVRNATFVLKDRDDARERSVELTLTYSPDNHESLNELEWRVEMKEERAREAERKWMLCQTALSKLTEEELEALGL